MDLDTAIWVGIAALIASFIGSAGGLSLATVMTPVLMAVVPVETAIVLVAAAHLAGNALLLLRHRTGWNGAIFRSFGLPLLAAAGASALLVGWAPSPVLVLILGLYLCAYAAFGLFEGARRFLSDRQPALPVAGLGSGFFTGTAGVGDGLRDHFLRLRLTSESALMMGALMALLADGIRLGIYFLSDAGDLLSAGAPVEVMGATVGAALAGILLGKAVGLRWQDRDLNRLLRWPLLVVGVYFVEKSIRSLFW